MDSPTGPPFQPFLSQRAREGASAAQVADLIDSVWQQIHAAMAPVIGQRGVAALYKRSLHLAAMTYPWLAAAQPTGGLAPMDLSLLRAEFARRNGAEAAAAGAALLLSFHGLVDSLIGPSLSGTLLGEVWAKFFSGSPAQDPPP
ncbi:hypothetical protein GCM10028796_51870 [Ramlibacter monticola]|uniref:Uncharacterized protein n=1 Tax=Ramlibacter monticola TaxID=1926872 RepID=A0A936Z1M1_9BURK|nr:hypothetical protein [Ramlibacter monticola]MBL0392005.1 hypothetical protein [Ramlibacter monticola]